MATLGAPNPGHTPTSPPRHSSSLYPPAPSYGPAGNNASKQYSDPKYQPAQQATAAVSSSVLASANGTEEGAAKPKAKRKKATDAGDSEAKPKRPKKPKDENAPAPKRRIKKEEKPAALTEAKPAEQSSSMYPPSTNPSANAPSIATSAAPQRVIAPQQDQFRPPPRPQSSGQRYDPVRGVSVDVTNDRPSTSSYAPVGMRSPPAQRSPSIASLIDPSPSSTLVPPQSNPPRSTPSAIYPPAPNGMSPPPTSSSSKAAAGPATSLLKVVDGPTANGTMSAPKKKTDTPPRKPSPKSAKAKEAKEVQPPPLPGSNLPPLTNGDLGKPVNRERKYEEVKNECIVIDVPIKKDGSGSASYVNFLKEVETKYGFDVAHPRVAEHRKRMKEIAAAGAALESVPGSADDSNLDVSEPDSDIEMGGQGEGSNSEGNKPKKGRRVNEKYDLDDDFIDDTEMIWQEQALASKDGYFVWSGPLIQEGDKPTIERADGTVKRGTGRGRGRGGTTRGDGTKTRGTRGGGPGSRGGTTVRKPRVTKADREKMQAEAQERERTASTASRPTLYPGTVG